MSDVGTLSEATRSHDVLARLQAIAWLFDTEEQCARARDRDLEELTGRDVASVEALAVVQSLGAIAEVLRAASEIELLRIEPALSAEDRQPIDAAIGEALSRVLVAAPSLLGFHIGLVPALGLRGRVLGRSIFVGSPPIADATPEACAWQAAHEATVSEVSSTGSFIEVERRAIGLGRSRARRAGLVDSHARWLSGLDLRALGPIPDVEDPAD